MMAHFVGCLIHCEPVQLANFDTWMTIAAYSEKRSNFLFPAFEYGQYFLSRGGGDRRSLVNCTSFCKISGNGYNINEFVLGDGIYNNVLMKIRRSDFENI